MKNPSPIASDLNPLLISNRRAKLLAYGFVFTFVACTSFIAFNPSSTNSSSLWFSSSASFKASLAPYKSQVSSLFSHFFPNSSSGVHQIGNGGDGSSKDAILGGGSVPNAALESNQTKIGFGSKEKEGILGKNHSDGEAGVKKDGALEKNQVKNGTFEEKNETLSAVGTNGSGVSQEKQVRNQTVTAVGSKGSGVSEEKEVKNQTCSETGTKVSGVSEEKQGKNQTSSETGTKVSGVSEGKEAKNGVQIKKSGAANKDQAAINGAPLKGSGVSAVKRNGSAKTGFNGNGRKREKWIEDMIGCDIFQGHWVKDEAYPLYPEGSCPHIDEPFDCYLNGRPDRSYQKLRWQPNGCNIPRLNARDMLERLRGKRLVFVGDSLNRNMWESLICVLRNSVKDKRRVFEASGKREFRTEGSYSFLFKDYGATVEFFRSPFLVQEWEMPIGNGTKETLRLDLVERSSSKYKDAHVLIFNTGHWWTHEKTAKGKDYYQEGNRVYGELNVVEAFHKALNTWAKWIDTNVNPKKTLIFFRGYSASHFSGGQWNSGGACDKETEPIKDDKYLKPYSPKMSVLESVIHNMKTPVAYLNITKMTDYRKDAHPSVYRKQNLTEEERKDPLRFQDCSHWCLPGVPDSWNELLYAQLIIKQYQMAL